jgi:hypothetical protein
MPRVQMKRWTRFALYVVMLYLVFLFTLIIVRFVKSF